METRERRRYRTTRKAERARREHARVVAGWLGGKARAAGYFKKLGALSCDCRHRHHGNPKVGNGVCAMGTGWRQVVVERIAGKRFCRKWAAGELPEEE